MGGRRLHPNIVAIRADRALRKAGGGPGTNLSPDAKRLRRKAAHADSRSMKIYRP